MPLRTQQDDTGLCIYSAFGSSCFLLCLLAIDRREEWQAAGEVLAIGCIVEVIQDFVFSHGTIFEWWDVRDDAFGILLALLVVQLIRRAPVRGSGLRWI